MAAALVQDMRSKGIKTVAFIGFADSYGDSWWNEFGKAAGNDIKLVAHERFQRNDASVMGQVLKAIAAKPDAVLIRSEEHTSELQSLMRISYAVFCLKKQKKKLHIHKNINNTSQPQN